MYVHGKGVNKERAVWEEKRRAYIAAIHELQLQYAAREGEHSFTIGGLTESLKESDKSHVETITRINADHTKRLLASEKRASVYKRQAQGSASDTGNLAEHAAKLDVTLEQGRQLVGELGATVRLRDKQLKVLGSVIEADRKLFTDLDTKQ